MRIAVLSDTHIPIAAQDMPKIVYDGIRGVDMILHAGDLVELSVLDRLSNIAPTKAVCGNMDDNSVCLKLPKRDIIKIGPVSIGLMHGWGPPDGLIELAKREFNDVDAVIFGHSHHPLNKIEDGVLFFNPGSPTDKIFAPYNSYGILEIDGSQITPKLIKL